MSAFVQVLVFSIVTLVVVYLFDLLVIYDIIAIKDKYSYVIAAAGGIILGTATMVLIPLGNDYEAMWRVGGGMRSYDYVYAIGGLSLSVGIFCIMLLDRLKAVDGVNVALYLHSAFDGFALGIPAVAGNVTNTLIMCIILTIHRVLVTMRLTANLLKKDHSKNKVLVTMLLFGLADFAGALAIFGVLEAVPKSGRFEALYYAMLLSGGSFIAAVFDDVIPGLKEGPDGFSTTHVVVFIFFTLILAFLPIKYMKI